MAIGGAGVGGNYIGGLGVGGAGVSGNGGGNNPPYQPDLYIITQAGDIIATQNNDLLVTN
jgi:hypothetical protein